MKSKFEEFNDGIAKVYISNAENKLERKIAEDLRFGEENVSISRHFAAKAADEQIDRVIHVLQRHDISTEDIIVIDEDQFTIDKTDNIKDSMPKITKISLKKLKKHRKKEFV